MIDSRKKSQTQTVQANSPDLKVLQNQYIPSHRPSLTEKEERVYSFLLEYRSQHGRSPTYAEIRDHFQYRNSSSVQDFIHQLKDKGYIQAPLGSSRKRAITLITNQSQSLGFDPGLEAELRVPLEGAVAAGRLTEAVHQKEFVDVPRSFVRSGGEYFALRVKGDSMIEDCIMDGDLVVIRRQHTAGQGQTVVALVDNAEATIKKYYKRKDCIELVPANPSYDVIRVAPQTEFKILGILSTVIRKLEY